MKCPYCGHAEQKVLDSRPARDGEAIRRRRECEACSRRFTTFEEAERTRLGIVKRDLSREDFNREKLLHSMVLACGKRPVSREQLFDAIARIERKLFDAFEQEVSTVEIGELVMDELYRLDSIAYIRYASVYREFDCPQQFAEIVRRVQKDNSRHTEKAKVST
ncbi:transcriptional regulator NrdR [Kamptonema cortianum]|nr:transcriptional regulator NrdR [Kamptonema cortianum]